MRKIGLIIEVLLKSTFLKLGRENQTVLDVG